MSNTPRGKKLREFPAYDSLARVLMRECLEFEQRAHGSPFVPRNTEDSRSRFRVFCAEVNGHISPGGDSPLKHAWWSAAQTPDGSYEDFAFLQGFGDDIPSARSKRGKEDLIREEVLLVARRGMVARASIQPPFDMPNTDVILIAYLVFDDGSFASLEEVNILEAVRSDLRDFSKFILCESILIRWDDGKRSEAISHWIRQVSERRVVYQSYHAILGPPGAHLDVCESNLTVLKLHAMCFERDWGAKESQLRSEAEGARSQAAAWAHDVKNYTGPLIAELRDHRRKGVDLSWPLQGVLILNAVSRAIQIGFNDKSSGAASTSDLALPRRHAARIVELALQYMLNYHDHSSLAFRVEWDNRLTTKECIDQLCTELAWSEDPESVLTHRSVLCPIAMLREVVMNMRVGEFADPVIRVSYTIEDVGPGMNEIRLILTQRIREIGPNPGRIESAPGIVMANLLFGPERGIGIGSIEVLSARVEPPVSGHVSGFELQEATYRFRVRFKTTSGQEAQ